MSRIDAEARTGVARGEEGVTLLETLVALGLFAITVATMGDFVVQQVRRSATNNHYTLAYSIAEEQLESVRALRYADMSSESGSIQKGSMTFRYSTSVLDDSPAPNLKKIVVNVDWDEPAGAKNVALETVYTAVRRF
jgi:Tfp pilus assembly protein PilV